MTPYEVIAGPFELYVAPVGEAFPKVDAVPGGLWELLGTNGSRNQDESGVVVTHSQTINEWKSAGSTLPQKAFRSEESLMIECKLADLSPETYAKILDATITTTGAGPTQAAEQSFALKRGSSVEAFALLVRGLSPMGDSYNAQYEVPIVYQGSSPKPAFVKGQPALLDVQFKVLEDATYGAGTIRIQTGAPS